MFLVIFSRFSSKRKLLASLSQISNLGSTKISMYLMALVTVELYCLDAWWSDVVCLYSGNNNYIDCGQDDGIVLNSNPFFNGACRGDNGNDGISVANGEVWDDLD